MQIDITFKNLESSEELKEEIRNKLQSIAKICEEPIKITIVLKIEKKRNIVEANVNCKDIKLYFKEEDEKMRQALDLIINKIKTKTRKEKEKINR